MFDYYDTLITPEEVADMLNCGMKTTYKLLKTGKIKAMRIGRVWKDVYKRQTLTGIKSNSTV